MRISNHRLLDDSDNPVPYTESRNRGGILSPRFLVIHYTAGASAASSIAHLTKKGAGASAHLVIGRDGKIASYEMLHH